MAVFSLSYIREAMKISDSTSREKYFKSTKKICEEIANSTEYHQSNYAKIDFVDYSDDDFNKVFNDWINGESKVITICSVYKNDKDSEESIDYIIKTFKEYKSNNPSLLGSLKKSVDRYGSTIDIVYSI